GTANGGQNTDQTPNTISFNVTSINDAPAGADKTITTNEDTAYTFAAADFGFSDPNDSPANAFQDVIITTLPASGTLLLNGVAVTAGQVITVAQIPTLTWTPPANGNGTAVSSFTFQVRDNGGTANGGQNTDQTPNTISFNVTSINDAPAGADKTITTNEDTAYTFAVADFGFSDPNDSPANAFQDVIITTLPAVGVLRLNGVAVTAGQVVTVAQIPTLTWTPPANGNGTAVSSFTFQVRDNGGTANGGQNTDQTPNTISFNVTSINDAPAGADKTITTNEDTAYTFAVADFGFSDPNDSPANAFQDVIIT
ncbi:Ig-like domain-containing protein, partial [Mesorhizobium sp. GR13]|uniref:Ig-like domain-containing protein n=1 Tax=Mesorhizobium sp. GR13 TaxID=2562308 RepID=UPI00197E44A5